MWRQGKGKAEFSDLKELVTAAPAEVGSRHGAAAASVQAYLIAHPEALQRLAPQPLELTRAKLEQALHAYRQGDRDGARQLAIGAYLEGFELVEAGLNNVDPALRGETERAMMRLRAAIGDGEPVAAVEQQIGQIQSLLDRVEENARGRQPVRRWRRLSAPC